MDSPNLSQLLRTAGVFITETFPAAVTDELIVQVRARHGIDIQISRLGMDPRDRHDTLTLRGDVHIEPYTFDGATGWGDASVNLTYSGVPVHIWTPLSIADAEILGLAVTA